MAAGLFVFDVVYFTGVEIDKTNARKRSKLGSVFRGQPVKAKVRLGRDKGGDKADDHSELFPSGDHRLYPCVEKRVSSGSTPTC